MKKLFLKLQEPYPLNIDLRHTFPYIAALGILIYLFLIIFQPFGLSQYNNPAKHSQLLGLGLMVVAWLSISVTAIPRILPSLFSEDSWSLGKEVLWNVWLCLSTIMTTTIYWSAITCQQLSPYFFYKVAINSVLFTIFFTPVGVMCVMSNYIRSLKQKLRKADELTRALKKPGKRDRSQPLEFVSETGKEKIKLTADKLLYIQSCDNYANVIIRKNGKSAERLIRSSLKNLEKQITLPFIVRCHRSFIVNLSRTRSITGNSRNYTLILQDTNQQIPVSRQSEKYVLKALKDLTH